jgi:ATP-dependent DNA helicase RecQ
LQKPKEILKQYWNFERFRPLQEEIINSILSGKDTLALLPTGGGKSICFQVPAMAMEGICIVVSPLIALMQDQVKNLQARNISAAALTSAMTKKELDIAFDNAIYGGAKFLYVSPERLETELFRKKIAGNKISFIAVDEAHCISQWGYDFRPSYLKIEAFREVFPEAAVIALTASATKEVVTDIQDKLKFRTGHNFFRQSFARKNLHYIVQHEENKLTRLINICNKIAGTGIIYVRNRRRTQEVADFLNRNSISADFYHAGLDAQQRILRQKNWIENKSRVIVATNAFGMGIDKPDVRFVVHIDLPDSLEAYYQEAGRAGRDEKESWVVCLYQHNDVFELKENLEAAFPPMETIKKTYSAICNYNQVAVGAGKGMAYDFSINQLSEKYKLSQRDIFSSVKFLEKEGYLANLDAFYQPTRLMFTAPAAELYQFQVRNEKWDGPIKTILRSYGGLFQEFVNINEEMLAKRCNMSMSEFQTMLKKLKELGFVDYIPHNGLPKIIFTENRVDSKLLYLSPEHYKFLKQRAEEKIYSVIDYVSTHVVCRSRMVLNYFDEKDAGDCGKCDICIERKKRDTDGATEKIKEQVAQLLSSRNLHLEELTSLLYHFDSRLVVQSVNELADDGKIHIDEKKNISKK